jgi:hypothetical protein
MKAELRTAIAKACHENNKIFCELIGDTSQVHWEDAPDWQRESALNGIDYLEANPDASESAQHDNWVAAKVADGWKYGPTKDPEAKTHPCIVPFDQLPYEQRFKDTLFRDTYRTFSKSIPAE